MTEYLGKQIGNYRVIRALGSGGFADVYLGEHVYLHTQAAIKILQTRLSQESLASFLQEAQTIASLDHPNIVRVLDFGVEEQTPFLVMAYAPNGTLRQRHPAGTRPPLAKIIDYTTQIAAALQYAHERKLIHRDVKPENMLIGQDGTLLLSDFGIAVVSHSSRYQGKQEVGGTVAYMAPEQLQGQASIASDQYALGIVVYEWLTGQKPFNGSFVEICSQHLLTPPPSLLKQVPSLPSLVEQAVFMALDKDPQKRFMTVQAFASALSNTLDDAHIHTETTLLDERNVPTVRKTPVNPVWTVSGSLPNTLAVGTLSPPQQQASRARSTRGFVLTIIALVLLLIGISSAGAAYIVTHRSTSSSGSITNTSSTTIQATTASTSAPTDTPTPTATPTPPRLASAETFKPNITLQCSGSCDDPVIFTIQTIVVSPANHNLVFTLFMKNNSQAASTCLLSSFTLQSSQDSSPFSPTGDPLQGQPSGSSCDENPHDTYMIPPGGSSQATLTFTFVPYAGIPYTLTVVYEQSYYFSLDNETSIPFVPVTLTF